MSDPEMTSQSQTTANSNAIWAWCRSVFRQVLAGLGLIFIVIAIPLAWATPFLPIGLPLGILGVVLLGTNSIWGRNWMEGVLLKHPWIERMAPHWLMRKVFAREKRDPEILNAKKNEKKRAKEAAKKSRDEN